MSILSDLQHKYGVLVNEAMTISKAGFTPESRVKFDAITTESDALYADIEREQRMAKISANIPVSAPPRDGFGTMNEVSKEHQKRAFIQWMRTGSSAGYEQRDLGVGTPSTPITGGNVLVPTTIGPMTTALKSVGQLVDFVDTYRTADGHPIVLPTVNDTANAMTLVAQAAANTTDLDPVLSSVTSNVDTATSQPVYLSNELLQDSYFDVEKWLNTVLATRWKRGVAAWISGGNSSNVAALGFSGGVTSAAPTAIAYQDLAALYGSLDAEYLPNSSFVMSSATRANLMGLISTTGQPILQTDVHGTPFNAIFGSSIVIDEYRASIAAGNVPILFGSLRDQYKFRIVGDFQIRALRELKALQNETVFVLYTRVGGNNTDAGTHPMKALTVHA